MRLLDLTLPQPEANLALDEALLLEAEHADPPVETLRIWESPHPMVVVGRASSIDQEVNQAACMEDGVPILRRSSGGAAIVAGPGCLMYAVVLSYTLRPDLRAIDRSHAFVLNQLAEALRPHVPGIEAEGISDLAISGRKISGNSMRCRQHAFLYHGTLLVDLSSETIERYLTMPPRQPDYRQRRSHAQFIAHLPIDRASAREALLAAWQPTEVITTWPSDVTEQLVTEKYSQPAWNLHATRTTKR